MKRIFNLLPSLLIAATAWGAEPTDYYKQCENKGGQALLSALYDVIGSPSTVGYNGLWTLYYTSDVDANGKIWDMYSTKRWNPGKEQCGNYSAVGSCYNREHSFPKSWFNDASPMYSDAYHIYPTDGKVNGQRSNFPFGECANGTTLPSNNGIKALGKLGTSTFPGYTGKVFEPDDEYKGDFARSYFYMAAAYNKRISTWSSDMLAKNNYPVFKDWAIELLLKWHRQDPVSKKELDRNEVVAAAQHNRNPFIDHPELVEYIWGDKKTEKWVASVSAQPVLNLPVDGSIVDMGITAIGKQLSAEITIAGLNLTSAVNLSVSTSDFQLSKTSISASAANAGEVSVKVTYSSSTAKTSTATLTVTSGSLKSNVTLKAQAIDGIPAYEATNVTEDSFTANWLGLGDETSYTLTVNRDGTPIAGYPLSVNAAAGHYNVTDLEQGTTYTYSLASSTLRSNVITVTTAEPIPSVQIFHDGAEEGNVELATTPGVASEEVELWMEIENISDPIVLTVAAPFEISTDKANWSRSLTLADMEDRFYLRVGETEAGNYAASIIVTAGDYFNDDAEVTATVTDTSTPWFIETFEPVQEGQDTYAKFTYVGSAASWNFSDVGIWDGDAAHGGKHAVRFGKTASSSITSATAKERGIGTVTFYAKRYNNDSEATIAIEYSADGAEWTNAGNAQIEGNSYDMYTIPVNVVGDNFIRLRQTAGKRLNLDDIEITDHIKTGLESIAQETEGSSWDAYCPSHSVLTIENNGEARPFLVYNLDGIVLIEKTLSTVATSFSLPQGFYIVSDRRTSRRVVVK